MKIHLLSGFLGSGKTTAIHTAAGLLMRSGMKTGVITNDQGIRLVDSGFLAAGSIPGRQVVNGCFCCNYSELDRQIGSLEKSDQPEIIFAESVGSCTDIVATVLKPLQNYRSESAVSLTVVCDSLLLKMLLLEELRLFEAEVEYIFWKQLEEASLVLLNKSDLVSPSDVDALRAAIGKKFGKKTILSVQASNAESVARWLTVLGSLPAEAGLSPEVDYGIYATGEAMMGWLDCDILIETGKPDAPAAAEKLVAGFTTRLRMAAVPVGHVKWLIDEREKLSLTASSPQQAFPLIPDSRSVRLLLNARVQVQPVQLEQMIDDCIAETKAETGAGISVSNRAAFQPGYPRPEHRMT